MLSQIVNVHGLSGDHDIAESELYLRRQYESFLLDVVEHYAGERPDAARFAS